MNFSLNGLVATEQEENIPFLGDLIDPDTSETVKNCNCTVKSIDFSGSHMTVKVIVTGNYNNAPKQFNHVITGVRLCLPTDNSIKEETPDVWTLENFSQRIKEIKCFVRGFDQLGNERPTRNKGIFVTTAPRVSFQRKIDDDDEEEDIVVQLEGVSLSELLDEVRQAGKTLGRKLEDLNFGVEENDIDFVKSFIPKINTIGSWLCESENDFKLSKISVLVENVVNTMSGLFLVDDKIIKVREKYKQKLKLIKNIMDKGFEFCSYEEFLKAVHDTSGHVLAVMISCEFDFRQIEKNIHYILNDVMKSYNLHFLLFAVDCDLGGHGQKSVIEHYRDGICLSKDVLKVSKTVERNLVDCSAALAVETSIMGMDRTLLKLSCPHCKWHPVLWTCEKCLTILEYCCNGIAVCGCGWLTPGALLFHCSKYFHSDYVPHDNLEELHVELSELRPVKQINILLVGQSGAGKSTWVNGLVNYLKYPTFEAAEAGKLISLVPMQFSICDVGGNPQIVCLEGDGDEDLTVGASATQTSRSYIIYTEGQRIAIVDTPGLGDTRGYERDLLNIRGVITHLKSVPFIHGICFVALPNETRLNVLLRFVFQEVIINLHKKVVKNLFFLFTNTRTTNYKPGSSLELIRQMSNNFRTKLTLEHDCVYSFDNEAFRFLAALKKTTIKFSKSEKDTYKDSWKITSHEVKRLLGVIQHVNPYESKYSVSLYNAHSTLLYLTTKELEAKRLKSVGNLEDAIKEANEKIKRLNYSLYEEVEAVKDRPSACRLVCASSKCVQVINGEKLYSTTCQNNFEIAPDLRKCRGLAQLRTASCMRDSRCTVCNCNWEDHMIIDKEQFVTKVEVANRVVAEDINHCESDIKIWKELKDAQLNQGNQIHTAAKIDEVADYIAKHSILLYNDAAEEYLSYLEKNEMVRPNKTEDDYSCIKRLRDAQEKMKEIKSHMEKRCNVRFVTTADENYVPFNLGNATFDNGIPDDAFLKTKNIILQL